MLAKSFSNCFPSGIARGGGGHVPQAPPLGVCQIDLNRENLDQPFALVMYCGVQECCGALENGFENDSAVQLSLL